MTLVAAWVAFPLVLAALALGCGLLLEAATGRRLPGALLPGVGLAVVVVVAQFLTLADATAELATPVVAALAVTGFALALPLRGRRPAGWALAAALATFAVFAAPIVLSGEATFAGYIRLDDTATWMALTDQVMEHGRSLDGLAPSTYEATLDFNLGEGYPVGVFLPLGAARAIVGQDVAWTIQPYMAWLAAVVALGLWSIVGDAITSPRLRALVAFLAAQPALLFGYYLWGGVKELAAAALIVTAVALVGLVIRERFAVRPVIVLGFACAALIGVLSVGGALWVAPALLAAMVAAWLSVGPRRALATGGLLVALVALLAVPVIATGGVLPPTSAPLTSADAIGNLIQPLDPLRLAGIWPAGDFRLGPELDGPTYVLIVVSSLAALAGLVYAWRRRAWTPLLYVGGALVACGVIYAAGSPWVDAKALATASPAIPLAAGLAGAALVAAGRRVEGALLLAALAGGILWSNVLAYRDVNLAPRDQLAELETIGQQTAGDGPALMTEYQPYGARHFLRDADPEAASELRRRTVPLRGGGSLSKGTSADTDELDLRGLETYRTLVLRRSPVQSRPPSPYRLTWRGDYYEVWQRPPGPPTGVRRHLPLGDTMDPVGRPSCARVSQLAASSRPGESLAAAGRPPPEVVPLSAARYPPDWRRAEAPSAPYPRDPGSLEASVRIRRAASYEVWLGGSVRPEVELAVDGRVEGSVRHMLNNDAQYVRLGEVELAPGRHRIEVRFEAADLHPGSGGFPDAIGPLVLSRADPAEARISYYRPDQARRLCGRSWDWIELVDRRPPA